MSSTNYTRNLYSKNALVRIVSSKPSEDRFRLIHITVDYQAPSIAAHKNELIIKLTDENDPFFLYSLYLNEDDYQSLKMSQGLLVDFSSFGEQLIGLLKGCEKEEKAENPRFQLCFKSKEPLTAILEVVENNPFRLLCHVSLNFSMGNDSDVKAYLADCLTKLKDQHIKLSTIYEQTKSDLTAKLDNAQKTLAAKMSEIDRLKSESETNVQRLTSKYGEELEFERERARQAEFASQQRYEKERKEAEANMLKTIKNMEMRVQELEHQNSELSEKRFKNEQALQDKSYQISTLQSDLANARSELAQFKKENTTLDMKLHSSEKQINQLDLQIGQLQRDLKDKSDQIARFQENLLSEQVQRRQLDEVLKEKQIEIKKKATEVGYYIDECKRGHDALTKLQETEKKLINQLKLKSKVLGEQDRQMNAKKIEIAQLSDECKSMKAQLQSLNDELNSLKSELKKKSSDLDEAMSKLSQKETLINYYNKQLNDREKISGDANKSYDPTSNSPAHTFRPYGNLLSTNSQFINTNLSPSTNGYPMAKSTSGSALVGFPSTELDITGAGRFGAATTGVMSTGVVGSVPKNPLLSSSSSSMSHHHGDHSKENLELNPIILGERTEKLKIGSASSSSTNGPTTTSGKLDPKYFHNPSLNTAQLGGGVGFDLQKKQQLPQSQQTMNHNQLPAHLVNPTAKSNNLIQQSGGAPMPLAPKTTSAKPTSQIASNYFPH